MGESARAKVGALVRREDPEEARAWKMASLMVKEELEKRFLSGELVDMDEDQMLALVFDAYQKMLRALRTGESPGTSPENPMGLKKPTK